MSLFASLIKDEEEKMKALQELQVNGEDVEDDDDDFNIGEDEDDTPSDQADDAATEEDTDVGEDDMADEEEDDFTLDDDEDLEDVEDAPADDAPTEDEPATDEGNAEENADNADAPAEGGEDAAPDVEGGGDDDFTMDGTEGGEEGGGDVGGDTTTTNDTLPADPSDGLSDEDMKESEKQIYDSLTDNQKRIRVLQLKIDFRDLYETIITTTEGVNNIPKNNDNLISIGRLIGALDKMKQILIDYVGNNFDKMSYLENYAMYLKYMAAFRTISKVIEEMNKAKD